jgi:hypothetical protein
MHGAFGALATTGTLKQKEVSTMRLKHREFRGECSAILFPTTPTEEQLNAAAVKYNCKAPLSKPLPLTTPRFGEEDMALIAFVNVQVLLDHEV